MKLTGEQIAELAPEWATHYSDRLSDTLFESEKLFSTFDKVNWKHGRRHRQITGIEDDSKPIPRKSKSFDITQHEWGDEAVRLVESSRDFIVLSTGRGLALNKSDSIAIAKTFGLTAEDLK